MHILKKQEKPILLKNSYELGFISFLKRPWARDYLRFAARTAVSKIKFGETVKVELTDMEEAHLFAHVDKNGLASVIIVDSQYPETASKKVLLEILQEFRKKYSHQEVEKYQKDVEMKFSEMDKMIKKYQDPKEADKLMKIESELDEIQGMLTKTMEDLLERGENLDDLLKESEDISQMAYNFYQGSKKANTKCCSLY